MARKSTAWGLFDNLNPREPAGLFAWVIISFVVVCVTISLVLLGPVLTRQKLDFASLFNTDFFVERRARQAISSMLIDPDSADFRNMSVIRTPDASTLVCGEVNGRNRMAGYAGFKRFVVSGSTGQAVIEPDNPASEDRMYSDKVDCDNAENEEDKSLACERAERSTSEYKAAKLYRELSQACPAGWANAA